MTDSPWEDCLLERKTEGDLKDLLKTIVAFANSVKPEHKAVILIGEKDDGTIQGVTNPDSIQIKVRDTFKKVYPPITNTWRQEVYEKEGKYCVRVEIEYDGETPHFGGSAWIRKGSETIEAPDEVFQKLIELRLSKVRELEKWIDKNITIDFKKGSMMGSQYNAAGQRPIIWSGAPNRATLLGVNNFCATLKITDGTYSEPLENITLNWDNMHNCLKLHIKG